MNREVRRKTGSLLMDWCAQVFHFLSVLLRAFLSLPPKNPGIPLEQSSDASLIEVDDDRDMVARLRFPVPFFSFVPIHRGSSAAVDGSRGTEREVNA
jgi:hypothetical protein